MCTAIYLLYNEGYHATHSNHLIRKDLCLEAMRLCKLLLIRFSNHTQVPALMSLMCFHTARFDSRIDDGGALVIFHEQDRQIWNRELIQSGLYYLSEAARGDVVNSYHLEASIAAQHCLAPSFERTNWACIESLYQRLYQLKPNPLILLNLAIVNGMQSQVAVAVEKLETLKLEKPLVRYPLLFATLGSFYYLLENHKQARVHWQEALCLTVSKPQRQFLQAKIAALGDG